MAWARRKVARHYQVLPWALDEAGLLDLLEEAEALELEEELTEIAYANARRKARREAKRGGRGGSDRMPGVPAGYELEWAEE